MLSICQQTIALTAIKLTRALVFDEAMAA